MPNVTANGIQIEYDTCGDPAAPPLLLVMGLGAQMIAWDEGFCQLLADRGHYVIRFDNRDVGLSTRFDAAGTPDLGAMMAARAAGEPITHAAYLLNDMADDAVGLLDALNIPAAHIVGASMGGMIVQAIAIRHPQRVLSMTSIMSTTGHPSLPQAKPEAMAVLLSPRPDDREAMLDQAVAAARTIGSTGFPFDEERVRARAARSFDRAFYPAGMARQMVAITASGNRRDALRDVKLPTLVIHGAVDPLVPVEGGHDTAACIPGAELLIIEGMGHDLPTGAWPRIAEAISAVTARVAVRA
ncbi:MAG: alpha/beta fold hydrolase [Tepidiformaceae bacterium]